MAKPALGRGLGALLGGNPQAGRTSVPTPPSPPAPVTPIDGRDRVLSVEIHKVHPCPFQPRKDFSEEALRDLAASIKEQGIVQPLIVRAQNDGFELIAGERRWRAAQMAGLAEVPVIVRIADDKSVLELALIENLQRENLNPLEEALGFSQLIEQFKLTQEEAAAKVGKSRAVVANSLRLLNLAPDVQIYVRDGRLSVGHAKVILGLTRAEEQVLAATKIIKNALNVRQTEELVTHLQRLAPSGGTPAKGLSSVRDAHVADLESKLQERFGTKVQLRYRRGKGALNIHFFNDDDLDRILKIAGISLD